MIWFLLAGLSVALVVSVWANVVLIKKNLVLSDQREALVDQIEESLDRLDTCYASLVHSSEIPVLSDEPVIRGVLSDIKRAKNAVLAIASKVVTYGQSRSVDTDDDE